MKLSKRAEKLRDELADADSYNQWADKQPDKNNYMHTYIRGFDQGYSAARLDVLEEALVDNNKTHGFTAKSIQDIKLMIFPDVEHCDCEGGCGCKYPAGFIELEQLYYHCLGCQIGNEDALKKYRGEQE